MTTPEPRDRRTNATVYIILFVLGLLQGVIGSFHYGQSPAPFVAILLAVIIFATCVFGGWGMKSATGGIVPALGWYVASFFLSAGTSEGTVIITATSPGEWYLYGGSLGAALGAGIAFMWQTLAQARPQR